MPKGLDKQSDSTEAANKYPQRPNGIGDPTSSDIHPAYLKLGNKFKIYGKPYLGPVVGSPHAIFLIVKTKPVRLSLVAGAMFGGALAGALGAAIGGAMAASLEGEHESSEIIQADLSDLPEEIRENLSWPVRKRSGLMFVVPRNVVQSAQYSFWGRLVLWTAPTKVSIKVGMIRARRTLRFLRMSGWSDGQF